MLYLNWKKSQKYCIDFLEHMELAWQMGGSRWFLALSGVLNVHLPALCQERQDQCTHTVFLCFFLSKVHVVMVLGFYLYFLLAEFSFLLFPQ